MLSPSTYLYTGVDSGFPKGGAKVYSEKRGDKT